MANFRTRMQAAGAASSPVTPQMVAAPVAPVGAPVAPAPQMAPAPMAPQMVAQPAPMAPQMVAQPAPMAPQMVAQPVAPAPQMAAQPVGPLAPAPAAPIHSAPQPIGPQTVNAAMPIQQSPAILPGQQVVQTAPAAFTPRMQGPRGESMSSVIRANVLAGQDNNTAWQNARAHFGITDQNNKYGYGMANWHRADLRKKGLLAPELDHVTRTRSGGGMRNTNKIKAWKNFAEVVKATDAALAAQISDYIDKVEASVVENQSSVPAAM